jgi:hypothetical protein
MINLSAYPLCAKRLEFQRANLAENGFNRYWAAVCVAFDLSDSQLTVFGGFNFDEVSDKNGGKLLSRLEAYLSERGKKAVANYAFASEGLKALLGSRGVKTSMLASEDDYWAAAEIMFPGSIKRERGLSSLYIQINAIPKKLRKKLCGENIRKLPDEWLSAHLDTPSTPLSQIDGLERA